MAKCGCGTGIEQDCPRCNPVRQSDLEQLRAELAKSQEEVEGLKVKREQDLDRIEYLEEHEYRSRMRAETAKARVKELEEEAINDCAELQEIEELASCLQERAKRYREALDGVRIKIMDSPYIYAGANYSLAELRGDLKQALTEPTKLQPGEQDPRD